MASENPKIPTNLLRCRKHQTWTKGHNVFCNLTQTWSHSSLFCTVRACVLWLPESADILCYSDITVVLAFDSVPYNFIHNTSNKTFVSTVKVYRTHISVSKQILIFFFPLRSYTSSSIHERGKLLERLFFNKSKISLLRKKESLDIKWPPPRYAHIYVHKSLNSKFYRYFDPLQLSVLKRIHTYARL
jgi:hypothetical protein